MRNSIYIVALMLLSQFTLFSQDSTSLNPTYRIFGGYSIYYHKPNFAGIPGVPNCCPQFNENSQGRGYNVGLAFELPLPYHLVLGLRGGINAFDANIEDLEQTTLRIDNQLGYGTIKHTIDANFLTLKIDSYLKYYLIDGLAINFGGYIAPFISKTYEQSEKVVSPSNAVFVETETKTRNQKKGDMPGEKGVWSGLSLGISYDIPMNSDKSLTFSPELSYTFGLNNLIDSVNWKANSLNLGIAINYTPTKPIEPQIVNKKILKFDTLVVENSDYMYDTFRSAKIDTCYSSNYANNIITNSTILSRTDTLYKKRVYKVNLETVPNTINIHTKLVTQAFQNLDMVFFERNNSTIQSNYNLKRTATEFDINSIIPLPLNIHNDILNIIGHRMRKNPNAVIQLRGYVDSTTETGNTVLALSRANEVKDYLKTVWQIDTTRLIVQNAKSIYPSLRTNTQNDSGWAENRRVQIISNSPEILAPIKRENFEEIISVHPREFKLITKGTDVRGIKDWDIVAYQNSTEIFRLNGDEVPEIISTNLTDSLIRLLDIQLPLEITFSVSSENGAKTFVTKSVNIQKDTAAIKVSRLALVLFDVGSDKIPKAAISEIKELLKVLKPDSKVKVIGYSDVLGDFEFNKQLSLKRANNAAALIKKLAPIANIIDVNGVGNEELPPGIYSHSSSAERFLSRTVIIEIIDNIR